MKKLVVLVAALVLALSLTAVSLADALNVGIIQMVENGAFADMREGFKKQMNELGYTEGENVNYNYQNAGGDATMLASICDSMIEANVDLVVTIATPPTQAFVNKDSGIPCFYISVSSPVKAGIITDMATPDKNATGTSNMIPVDAIFELAAQLTPGCKTFGLVYCTSETNSLATIALAKEYMDANNIAYKEKVVTNSSEVAQAVEALVDDVDAFYISNDSVVQSAMTTLAEIAADAGVPVYGSSAVMTNSGALADVSISDTAIGAATADMVNEYLNGKAVSEIPAIYVTAMTTTINAVTLEKIQATVPAEIDAVAVYVGK